MGQCQPHWPGDTGAVSIDSNPVKVVGGYRLVRKLGQGARAEVFLGHSQRQGSGPVAIKIYQSGVSDASIGSEAEALVRADGEHSLRLLDVTTAPDGAPALILARIAGPSLARLLADRGRLQLGEAITILASLSGAISRLHGRGVVHSGLGAHSVLFDSAGAPVLARFGRAFLITPDQPPALLNAVPGIALDIEAFARLTAEVLGRVDHPEAREIADWTQSNPALETDAWFEQLADRLFDSGRAEPVDTSPDHAQRDPVGVAYPFRFATEAEVPVQQTRRGSLSERVGRLIPAGVLPNAPAWLASAVARIRAALAVVRPRVWFVGAAVAAALIVALIAVPQTVQEDAPGAPAVTNATPTAVAAPQSPVDADDPISALVALLAARDRCIHDLSVLCLDSVGQEGSSALGDDQRLVRSLQNGGQSPESLLVSASQVTLDERSGDSVLLKLGDVPGTAPASVLVMKTPDGWRIRDYLQN
jgi:hypothetical protein